MINELISGFSIDQRPVTIKRVGDWLEFSSGSFLLAARVAAIAYIEKGRLSQKSFLFVGLGFLLAALGVWVLRDAYTWQYLSPFVYAMACLTLAIVCLVIFAIWRPHILIIGLASGRDIKLSGPTDAQVIEQFISLLKKT